MINAQTNLVVTSNAFENNGTIPIDYTGYGKDISPNLILSGVSPEAQTVAVLMDDIKHPLFRVFNHWIIWNLPVMQEIPENMPHGKVLEEYGGAMQGVGYGRHRYRGPKPPFGGTHMYRYNVYILDCRLELKTSAKKKELLKVMENHILQHGFLVGKYK